jgi:putative aldouronate transport system permease protein
MLHEVGGFTFKRLVQSLIYIPHFISWVVVIAIWNYVFGDRGVINVMIQAMGFPAQPFMYSERWFLPMILLQDIWKECGWGTIIFIAALANVNPDLYEAATVDGAGRFQKMWHITLPAIKSTIVVMLILRLGRFLDTGFEHIFLMLNSMNRHIGEVFDTFIYDQGILQGRFSYTMAISVFKSVVGFALVMGTDKIAKKMGEDGII